MEEKRCTVTHISATSMQSERVETHQVLEYKASNTLTGNAMNWFQTIPVANVLDSESLIPAGVMMSHSSSQVVLVYVFTIV